METGTRNPGLSAEEDLELERKLAKKLKVKAGKLRGVDDGINVLFEGIPSIVDFPGEEVLQFSEECAVEETKKNPLGKKGNRRKSLDQALDMESELTTVVEEENASKKNKKRKKKKRISEKLDDVVTEDSAGDESMPVESHCVEAAVDKVPPKAQKYVAPYLRLQKGAEPEDHTQLRRRVRGVEVV